jgi:hypothetical protein
VTSPRAQRDVNEIWCYFTPNDRADLEDLLGINIKYYIKYYREVPVRVKVLFNVLIIDLAFFIYLFGGSCDFTGISFCPCVYGCNFP